jgi:hypothetical protein
MIRALALFSVATLTCMAVGPGCSGDGTANVGAPIDTSGSAGAMRVAQSGAGNSPGTTTGGGGATGTAGDSTTSSSSGGATSAGSGGYAGEPSGSGGASGSGGSNAAGSNAAAGATGSGGRAGASDAGGAGSGSPAGCDAPGLVWKTGSKTNFTSYPDPGSEECIKYSGCMYEGQFAGCNKTEPLSWVMSHNIVAAFPDFTSLKLHDLCLKSGTKTILVTVLDTCGDNDCNGCCTKNKGTADELIDVESFTNARWGVPDGRIQWADLGPTKGMGCQ